MSLTEKLAEYRAGWYQRVPADRQAIIERHIDELRNGRIARTMLKVGDRAPRIVLLNAKGKSVDVRTLLKRGPVIVAFYRGGWCPYCNLALKAFQEILPEIQASGASLWNKGRGGWRPEGDSCAKRGRDACRMPQGGPTGRCRPGAVRPAPPQRGRRCAVLL